MIRDTFPADEIASRTRAIGQYYGFTPLALLPRTNTASAATLPEAASLDPVALQVTTFLKRLERVSHVPSARQPLFVSHTNLAPGRSGQKKAVVQFHALGTDRPIAAAVVIRVAMALVRDLTRREPVVYLNSMGDKETRARYVRELGNVFRKRGDDFPSECAARAQADAFGAAELAIEQACTDDLPSPIEHLSDASRKRFEDLLEYLEMIETPYELSRHLVSRGNAWNDACFEIAVDTTRFAWGSHYTELARRVFPAAPHAFGAVIRFASDGAAVKAPAPPRLRFALVHIGDEAKHLSIRLAEEFRRARLPLTQHVGIESLTEQIRLAEHVQTPYLVLIGRKEALDGSAILRHRATELDTIVPLEGLVDRLRTLA
jgi:histidyl-tRNA synthetase